MCLWLILAPFLQAIAEPRHQPAATPQDGQALNQDVPQPLRFTRAPVNRTWEITKSCIHVLALLTSGAGVAISAYILSAFVKNPIANPMVGNIGLPILGLSFIWNLYEVLTRAKSRFMVGMLPGAHVSIDFCISLAAFFLGGSLARGASPHYQHRPCDDPFMTIYASCSGTTDYDSPFSSSSSSSFSSSNDDNDWPIFSTDGSSTASTHDAVVLPVVKPGLAACVAAFVLLAAFFHFFFFIAAWVDARARDRANAALVASLQHHPHHQQTQTQTQTHEEEGKEMASLRSHASTSVEALPPPAQAPMDMMGVARPEQTFYASNRAERAV